LPRIGRQVEEPVSLMLDPLTFRALHIEMIAANAQNGRFIHVALPNELRARIRRRLPPHSGPQENNQQRYS